MIPEGKGADQPRAHARLPPLHAPTTRGYPAPVHGAGAVPALDSQSWVHSLRCRVSGRLDPADSALLAAEVVRFVECAPPGFHRGWWLELLEALRLLQPLRDCLAGQRKVLLPSLEKLHQEYGRYEVLLGDLDVLGALRAAFPYDRSALFTLPKCNEDPCEVHVPPICLRDLPRCLGHVGAELASLESAWPYNRGSTALALTASLPVRLVPEVTPPPHRPVSESPSLLPVVASTLQVRRDVEMSGFDAADLLVRCRHLGKSIFLYLNPNKSPACCFYDLRVTSPSSLQLEHWVFSPFGVLHVSPEDGSEALDLGVWHREAVLCRAMREIPFFRHFLKLRRFTRWRQNMRRIHFAQKCEFLNENLVLSVPHFIASLQHIYRLLMELSTVSWLPQAHQTGHSYREMQDMLLQTRSEAQNRLQNFLTLVSQILFMVRDDTCNMVQSLQKDMERLSSARQADKKAGERHLRQAESWVRRLGSLSALVGQTICQNLLTFLQRDVCGFVNNVIQSGPACETFLHVSLEFGPHNELMLNPSGDCLCQSFRRWIDAVIDSVLEVTGPVKEESSDQMRSLPLTSNIQALAPGLTAEDLRMVLPKPEVTPKRSEDMPGPGGLMVLGRMERGNNLPLHLHPLRHLLSNDGALPEDTGRLHCALEASLCEVWRFCEEHSWLSEVRSFIQSWSLEILEKLRGGAAPEYEDVIQRVQTWQERVLCVKESITTPAFMVSCLPISRQLALPLADIMQDLLLSLTSEVSHRSQSIMEELNQVMEIFQSVKTDIPSFTEFTKKVDTYTQSSASLQLRMDHVLSLKTIIQMNIRSPSPEEETLHCQLMETWDHFHQHLKNASEFLNINRFSMLASLEQSFLSCYSEADRVIEVAQAPMFLDPSQDSRQVLKELKDMCRVLHTLTIELRDLSCSRQALQGKTFDILRISQGEKELRGREAAWKLLERSTEQITEWKRMPFIKVNADRMKEKLSGWESSLQDITLVLPDDDPVICRVKDILRDFSHHIPLLQALGNPALKPKHWEAIFTGMGWRFPGLESLNVGDLLMFPLLQHQDEIQKARLRAEAEVTSVQTFRKLQATWQERQFHLAKLFLHVKPRGPAVDRSCRPPSGRFREAQEQVQVMDSGAVVLMDTLPLYSLLDDSLLSLRVMMTSPTLPPDLQDELNDWTHRLEELDQHVDLWIQFQEKWVFITKVRNEIEPLPTAGTKNVDVSAANESFPQDIQTAKRTKQFHNIEEETYPTSHPTCCCRVCACAYSRHCGMT